jgi:hypothetical protein
MSETHASIPASATLAEVKAAALDLLARASGPDLAETDLFPYGITRIAVSVKALGVEVALEISGPDHSHDEDEDDDWLEEDVDGVFNGDD